MQLNTHIFAFFAVLTTVAVVITTTTVSTLEILLFTVQYLIGFGGAITAGKHEIFKPASKPGYPFIW